MSETLAYEGAKPDWMGLDPYKPPLTRDLRRAFPNVPVRAVPRFITSGSGFRSLDIDGGTQ